MLKKDKTTKKQTKPEGILFPPNCISDVNMLFTRHEKINLTFESGACSLLQHCLVCHLTVDCCSSLSLAPA